jgi:hypothetical protein
MSTIVTAEENIELMQEISSFIKSTRPIKIIKVRNIRIKKAKAIIKRNDALERSIIPLSL